MTDSIYIDGKVRIIGASNFNAEQLRNAVYQQIDLGFDCFSSVQNNNNFAVSDLGEEYRQICVTHQIEIVTYSPLGAGFLTGKYQNGVQAGTRFSLIPGHQTIYFNEAVSQRLIKLQMVSANSDYTQTHLALAWALHQPGVSYVLIGGRTINHLEQAFTALAFNDPDILAELE